MFNLFDDMMNDDGAPVAFLPDPRPAAVDTFTKTMEADRAARDAENAEIKAARAAKRAARLERNAERVAGYDFGEKTLPFPGGYIYFDTTEQKTRVIFEKRPPEKVREAVKAAGFWYNGAMKSWNRRLNMKTYRAAQELAVVLAAYMA